MTDTTPTPGTKLSDLLKNRTAGALPSSRTEDMLTQALESNDIDEVKGQLMHVWAHYQSLEFSLNDVTLNAQVLREAKAHTETHDVDDIELAVHFFAAPQLETAYEAAHQVNTVIALGMAKTVPDALRVIYRDLDHSDPEREAFIEAELRDIRGGDGA